MKRNKIFFSYLVIFLAVVSFALTKHLAKDAPKNVKLYWFIPDGLRAEPIVFKIYQWAREGELPNIKKMMDEGSFGYSKPVFPSHTPVNFATLLTGSYPTTHGVADGAMRVQGYPLSMVARGGFSSTSKKVPSIWTTLENNSLLVSLLSIPGSTPPELNRGNTIRGRWGAWGLEFPSIIYHDYFDKNLRDSIGINKRVFTFGADLTRFAKASSPRDWKIKLPVSFSEPREVTFTNWGSSIHCLLLDTTNDSKENYDEALFSIDKEVVLARVHQGAWSDWLPTKLQWQTKNDYNNSTPKKTDLERDLSSISLESKFKITVIKLGKKDFFRIRFLYDGLNSYSTQPPEIADRMEAKLGPMVDFVDNYPPQLIYFQEDKNTFLQEANFSLDWHKSAVSFLTKDLGSEVVIQSIYTPNQMLTSRWWLPYLDPQSPRYNEVDETVRASLWKDVKGMYKKIDAILGEVLKASDPSTYVVFSSDHGALPLYKEVRLNNLFAKKGWLTFKFNKEREENEIDWEKTKVVFLQMDNIYINPKGLSGIYEAAKGEEYEKLRSEVIHELSNVFDEETKIHPLSQLWKREEVESALHLPSDRVGDLVIANAPPYLWTEDTTADLKVFVKSLRGGYKQAVSNEDPALLTPFMIKGPGVKKNFELSHNIHHVDQYSTILDLLGVKRPAHATGMVLEELKTGTH